jgi:hypothetical protein
MTLVRYNESKVWSSLRARDAGGSRGGSVKPSADDGNCGLKSGMIGNASGYEGGEGGMMRIVPPGLVMVLGLFGVLEAQTTAVKLRPLSRQYARTVSPACAKRF